MIQINQNNENYMLTTSINHNPDSSCSNLEITETPPVQQQQRTSLIINENNKLLSKLVIFKDVSNDSNI